MKRVWRERFAGRAAKMEAMPDFTVLLIDSDGITPILGPAVLIVALRLLGAQVLRAATGAEGLRLLYDSQPDVMVLPVDAGSPGAYETLVRVRAVASVPVVMVGRRAGSIEDARAIAAGADEYVVAPLDADDLADRIRRLAERAQRDRSRERIFTDGDLEVDFAAIEVSLAGTPIQLTRLEYRLLEALVERTGEVIDTERLLELAWDAPIYDRGRVKAHIAALRRKLGPVSDRVETVRGAGYRYRRAGSG
jgi:DNA-binding response OmpR family regulator